MLPAPDPHGESMDLTTIAFWLLAYALVGVGLAGAVLPALPGLPFVFIGLATMAWLDGFVRVGYWVLGLLAGLTVIGIALDFIASSFGAKRFRASPRAVTGAALGTLVGLFFGIPGLLLGPFAGAVVGEIGARSGWRQAAASGVGTWVGLLLGTAAKLGISIAMIATFAFAWFV